MRTTHHPNNLIADGLQLRWSNPRGPCSQHDPKIFVCFHFVAIPRLAAHWPHSLKAFCTQFLHSSAPGSTVPLPKDLTELRDVYLSGSLLCWISIMPHPISPGGQDLPSHKSKTKGFSMLFRSSLRSSHCNHMFKEFGPKKAPSGQYTVPVTTVPPTVSPFGFLRSSHRPGCLASLAGARRTTRAPARHSVRQGLMMSSRVSYECCKSMDERKLLRKLLLFAKPSPEDLTLTLKLSFYMI